VTTRCRMELCTHWSGDGDVCPCAVFGMQPNTPDWVEGDRPESIEWQDATREATQ
jgi:hypothetical protein